MFFTEDILKKRFREVRSLIYRDPVSIFPMQMLEATEDKTAVHNKIPDELYDSDLFVSQGDLLSGRDAYFWLTCKVCVPVCSEDQDIVGIFDFSRTDQANAGFEAQIFVDGTPYAGVDQNHTEILFNDFAGKTVCLTFLLWTGIDSGISTLKMNRAEIAFANKTVEALYIRLLAMHQSIQQLQDDPYAHDQLLNAAAVLHGK